MRRKNPLQSNIGRAWGISNCLRGSAARGRASHQPEHSRTKNSFQPAAGAAACIAAADTAHRVAAGKVLSAVDRSAPPVVVAAGTVVAIAVRYVRNHAAARENR